MQMVGDNKDENENENEKAPEGDFPPRRGRVSKNWTPITATLRSLLEGRTWLFGADADAGRDFNM